MWKSRLIYSAILIAAFVFSQALYDPVSLLTFIVLLLIPVLSIILGVASYPLMKVKISVSNNVLSRFDPFVMRVGMLNTSPFISSSFKLVCTVPDADGKKTEKVTFLLNASCGRLGYFDYRCVFANRGVYGITVESVEFYDFLRLIKLKKNIGKELSVHVGARRIKIDFPVNSELQNQENTNLIGTSVVLDGGDMIGVRDYVVGDNVKNIHWKLSSKSESLVMKSFAEDIFDQAYVIADMSACHSDEYTAKSLTDCVVETTLSVIRDYQKSGIRFSLIVNTSKSEISRFSIATPAELLEAEMFLSMTPMVRDTSVIDLLSSVDRNVLSGCEVSVITSNISEEIYKSIKKQFVDKNSDLKIVNIALDETDFDAGIITFTKDFIEKQGMGVNDEI